FFEGNPASTPPLPAEFVEIKPEFLNKRRARLEPDALFRMTINAPPGARIKEAVIRWVHIREDHERNPPSIATLFKSFAAAPVPPSSPTAASLNFRSSPHNNRTLFVQPTQGPADSIVIDWTAQTKSVLEGSVMEHEHSLVWPLITIDIGAKEQL